VKGKLEELEKSKGDHGCNGLEKLLKLYTTNTTTNMHLFDANDTLQKFEKVSDIIDSYYDEYYMGNSLWDARVFINGEWKNMTPSNEKIWEHIQLIKLQEKEEEEKDKKEKEEDEEEEEEEDKQKNGELKEDDILDEKDKLTLTNIKVFFEKMLEEKPLTPEQIENLQQMNQIQQLSCLFNIYMTNENYEENEHLLKEFLNVCLKFLQKDIELITKKMENEESDELSIRLQRALEVYSSTLLIKQTFNI
jgi:hypothetical protein